MDDIRPGVYPEMSNEDYHGHYASYSKSSLVDFSVYPYNLKWQRKHRKSSDAMTIGTAAHTAILEPEKWESEIIVAPPEVFTNSGAKGKAYAEWFAQNYDGKRNIISPADRQKVMAMRESIMDNPAHSQAKELLTGGQAEVSCFWNEIFKSEEQDTETGYWSMHNYLYADPEGCHPVMFKCRPDYIPADKILVDLKTTKTPIDRDGFEKQAYNMHYHWSAGLTLRGMRICTEKPHRIYIFVVVEVEPPHEVAVFRASQEFIALGQVDVLRVMGRLAYCDKNNWWPGAPNRIQQVGLPGWAMKKLHNI